jgi:hypothetical protein
MTMSLFHVNKLKKVKARRRGLDSDDEDGESDSDFEGEIKNRRTSKKFQSIVEKYRLSPASQSSNQKSKAPSDEKSNLKKAHNLVVVPKSVLEQWKDEIEKHSKPGTITVMKYYEKNSRNIKLEDFDVVITTYDILGYEYRQRGNLGNLIVFGLS